jgi:polysaccharide pyruvyl transferase WcaK-like protein
LILEGLRQLFKDWMVVPMNAETIDFGIVNNCDLFVLGGGELIGATHLFGQNTYPWSLHWVNKVKVPKVILGCGVNAENAGQIKQSVIRDLERFDFIGLRDEVSVKMLRSFPKLAAKVDLFYDCALAVDTEGFVWRPCEDLAVVVPTDRFSAKHDRGIREFNVLAKSWNWLTEKLALYGKAVFVPFGKEDNDDFQTCRSLSFCAKNSVVLERDAVTLRRVLELFSVCRMVFPYRLHGLVLAYLVGASYEFYPYHWKLQRMHDTLAGCRPEEIREQQRASFDVALGGLGC